MALTKSLTFKKATYAGAYAKVTNVSYSESGLDGDGKKYLVKATVNMFADDAKDTDLYQEDIMLADVRENKLSLTEIYNAIKADKFSGWSDC